MLETTQLAFIQQVHFSLTDYLINTGLKIHEIREFLKMHLLDIIPQTNVFTQKEKKGLVYFIKLPLSKGK